jgi:hypothetical protein
MISPYIYIYNINKNKIYFRQQHTYRTLHPDRHARMGGGRDEPGKGIRGERDSEAAHEFGPEHAEEHAPAVQLVILAVKETQRRGGGKEEEESDMLTQLNYLRKQPPRGITWALFLKMEKSIQGVLGGGTWGGGPRGA